MLRSDQSLSRSIVLLVLALIACGPASGTDAGATPDPASARISAGAIHQRLQSAGGKPLIVDVREPHEFETVRIQGARLAPLGNVLNHLKDVDKDREIVLVCRSDNRSGKAQRLLAARGYTNLRNMEGGMLAWEKSGLPVVKKK